MHNISIVPVDRLELAYSSRPWPFAVEKRREIDAHFVRLQRERPALWNGRVLLLHEFTLAGGVFRGTGFDTDFASFIAWRDWDIHDAQVQNFFAMGALQASDGGFIVGVMAAHTSNAGKIYFPAGTPDLSDVVGDRIDLEASMLREVGEETGLSREDFVPEPGWMTVLDGRRIAQIRVLHAHANAAELRARILDHLAGDKQPELTDVRVVRSADDFDPMMPPFMTAFLTYIWDSEAAR
jgi:8-oxo-dGTP pyrophosphatase MutT (NUDIX family)